MEDMLMELSDERIRKELTNQKREWLVRVDRKRTGRWWDGCLSYTLLQTWLQT